MTYCEAAPGDPWHGPYHEREYGFPIRDDARLFERLTFLEVLQKRLRVMDSTAVSLCMENKLPILVFNMTEPGNVERVLRGEQLGTLVE